jgi:hypothetical protein
MLESLGAGDASFRRAKRHGRRTAFVCAPKTSKTQPGACNIRIGCRCHMNFKGSATLILAQNALTIFIAGLCNHHGYSQPMLEV